MGVLYLCQSSEDQQWYYHWQKARLRWWKKVNSILSLPDELIIIL